jgi:hypothetical protein
MVDPAHDLAVLEVDCGQDAASPPNSSRVSVNATSAECMSPLIRAG